MKRALALLIASAGLVVIYSTANAAPVLKPSPTPTPTVAPYTLGREVITESRAATQDGRVNTIELACPTGKVAIGGGFESDPNQEEVPYYANSIVKASYPSGASTWRVDFAADGMQAVDTIAAWAICVNP